MSNRTFPFAVRLIGFSDEETSVFDSVFAHAQGKGYGYFRLTEGNLQDPDLYIANAAELKALVRLVDLKPSDVRPALLVGQPVIDLPYSRIPYPLQVQSLLEVLDALVKRRADALSRLAASDVVSVPERRRRDRVDLDLTDPAEYEKMRAKVPKDGIVLIVDKSPVLRDYLADLLVRQKVPVAWVSNEADAIELCKRETVAAVMINTSTPEVEPYGLCWAIKEESAPLKTAVIFLVSKPFEYDVDQARYIGVEGYLNKPLASHHLITALKKCLPHLH